jgi:hypothetical protein
MAVKITTEAIVRMIRPEHHEFTLTELNDHVKGWIEPLKIGPIWVMYKENAKESGEPLNQVASFFFDVAMYGDVLIVPPQQMPPEWGDLEEEEERYSADQVDTGFLSALQSALVFNKVFGSDHVPQKDSFNKLNFAKEEWSYTPSDDIDENTKEFFRTAYESIIKISSKKDDTLLFENEDVIVRAKTPEDKKKTFQQMIDYFVELEEYEKCAALKKLIPEE